MKVIYTTILTLILGISTLQGQNDPFEGMDLFQELFGNMMGEMGQALEDSKMHMQQFELKDLGDGRMSIEGDTVNIGGMFRMLSENLDRMPEQLKPEEHIDNLEETAEMLPDLLMKSAEMLQSGAFEQMFEEMLNEIGLAFPDSQGTPRSPEQDTEFDEPRPTPPKGHKEQHKPNEQGPKKKLKHRKTITI